MTLPAVRLFTVACEDIEIRIALRQWCRESMYIKMSVKTQGGADDFSQCEHHVSMQF